MAPFIHVGDVLVPSYTLMAGIGCLIAASLFSFFLVRKNMMRRCSKVIVFAIIGVIVGGKLFAILSIWLGSLYQGEDLSFMDILMKSGIVYYGGLLGMLLACYLFCCWKKIRFAEIYDEIAVCIPVFHCFGRVGCFLAGCCYGKESSSTIAVLYDNGENVVQRIPVQLIEACFELLFAIFLIILYRQWRGKEEKGLLQLYLLVYGTFRFIIEFFRGDTIRGIYGGLSFSQYISIILIISFYIKDLRECLYERKMIV